MSAFPRIGITPDINDVPAPETEYVVRKNYADAVVLAGGLPLFLPYTEEVTPYLDILDGLVITGGMFDVDPALYGQAARKQYVMKPPRTSFEKKLIEGALQRKIPVLGICNGMQLLAVCLGGQLVQDIPTEIASPLEHKPDQPADTDHHSINIVGRSGLLELPFAATFATNSVHHQSVMPADTYRTIATTTDGVVEAIEKLTDGFAVGVQWHPEYGVSPADALVWDGFLLAANKYSLTRAQ